MVLACFNPLPISTIGGPTLIGKWARLKMERTSAGRLDAAGIAQPAPVGVPKRTAPDAPALGPFFLTISKNELALAP